VRIGDSVASGGYSAAPRKRTRSIVTGFPSSSSFEVRGGEIGDRLAIVVGDDGVDLDEVRAAAKDRRLWRLGAERPAFAHLLRLCFGEATPQPALRVATAARGASREERDRQAAESGARCVDDNICVMQPLTTLAEDERLLRDSVYEFADRKSGRWSARWTSTRSSRPALNRQVYRAGASMGIEIPTTTAAAVRASFMPVLAVEALSRVDPSIGVYVDVQNTLVINALLRWVSDEIPSNATCRRWRRA
jgi:hypothetical protein